MKVLHLPPSYSDDDEVALANARRMLAELDAEYRKLAEPIIQCMVAIQQKYPAKMVLVPDNTTAD
jgi:hypothetical protein